MILVFLCNIDYKAEISIYKLVFRSCVASLCFLSKLNFFFMRNHMRSTSAGTDAGQRKGGL